MSKTNEDPKNQDPKDDPKDQDPKNQNPTGDDNEDDVELDDKVWAKVFKTKKFQDLKASDDELKTIKDAQKKKEEDDLKAKGEFETLSQKQTETIQSLESALKSERLINKVALKANSLGLVDVDTVVKLLDKDALKYDKEGQITNLDEVLNALLEEKPFLKGEAKNPQDLGNPTNPSSKNSGKKTYRESELRELMKNHQWYIDNKDEVSAAYAEGRVLKNQ